MFPQDNKNPGFLKRLFPIVGGMAFSLGRVPPSLFTKPISFFLKVRETGLLRPQTKGVAGVILKGTFLFLLDVGVPSSGLPFFLKGFF